MSSHRSVYMISIGLCHAELSLSGFSSDVMIEIISHVNSAESL